MRRPPYGHSSSTRFGGRVCSDVAGVEISAGVHFNYAETVSPMRDGLPKLKDFPGESGGSGEIAPE
jgi:hypothetical protein